MEKFHIADVPKTDRITHLVDNLYAKMPVIESARAKLITESYKATEDEPIITRRAKAFAHILHNIPIIIRDEELIVGSSTLAPRGCQTFPEYSFQWLEDELDTVATRTADPFYIAEETKAELREVHKYWKGKTTSELATSYMAPEAILAIDHNIFTPGNYFYNGVGHVTVKYEEVLAIGYEGIIAKAQKELDECNVGDGDYAKKSRFLEAVIMSCQAVIDYAHRYAELAEQMAYQCQDPTRKQELLQIASNCTHVPAKGARNFYEACQSFWFVQQLIQMESSGHSISPGRFDQYMYPYYKSDIEAGNLTREFAQELMDCIWVKLNDLNKCRDAAGLNHGEILGFVPKINLPNYNEFYEARYFTSGENLDGTVHIDRDVYRARYESDTESDDVEFEIEMAEFDGFEELEELEEDEEPDYIDENDEEEDEELYEEDIWISPNMIFTCEEMPKLQIAAEICEDLWVPNPPSVAHAYHGANLIVNLSASDEVVGKDSYRRSLVSAQSARLLCGYIYATAGEGESTQDVVYGGQNLIAENLSQLSESQVPVKVHYFICLEGLTPLQKAVLL